MTMRKGLFVVGLVLLLLGVAAAGFITYEAQVPITTNIQAGHQGDLTLSSLTIGPQYSTIHWSNAQASDTIYVTTSVPITCNNPANQVASGTGSSGSFALTLTPGTHYYVFDCASSAGPLSPVSVNYTSFGLTYITIGGIAFAVIGAVLLVVSLRKAPPTAAGVGGPSSGSMPPAGPGGSPPP